MIIVTITTTSFTVAITIALTSIIVLIHIIMISTIVANNVKFMTSCAVNVTIFTARNNASISIQAPILLLSLLLFVRVPSSAQ